MNQIWKGFLFYLIKLFELRKILLLLIIRSFKQGYFEITIVCSYGIELKPINFFIYHSEWAFNYWYEKNFAETDNGIIKNEQNQTSIYNWKKNNFILVKPNIELESFYKMRNVRLTILLLKIWLIIIIGPKFDEKMFIITELKRKILYFIHVSIWRMMMIILLNSGYLLFVHS